MKKHKRTSSMMEISNTTNIALNIVLAIYTILTIMPIALMISVSFTAENELVSNGYRFFPKALSIYAYQFIFKMGDQILRSLTVSVAVTVLGTMLGVIIMSALAYVIYRKDFKYSKQLAFFVFFTMLFNGGLVPSYIVNTKLLNLQDTLGGLIFPVMVNGFYIMILRTFYKTSIPPSLIEAARVDGAGEFRIFLQIVLPLSLPGLATIAMFTSVFYWNDWYMGLLYISKPELTSLQYMLMKIQSDIEFLTSSAEFAGTVEFAREMRETPAESARMALAVITIIPILVAYPFFQKYFVKGLTVGSVKG